MGQADSRPPMWENLERVCKPNAAMLFFSQMPFSASLVMSNPKAFRYEWIWQKSNKTGFLNANRMPLKAHENILVFYRRLPTYNPQFAKGKEHTRGNTGNYSTNYGKFTRLRGSLNDKYYPTDIIAFSCVLQSTENKVHPTQKPVPLLEYLIRTYTNPGETVLDFCMGSGSTGVAAVNTGLEFVGIEKDAGYFEIARKRIAEAQEAAELERAQVRMEGVV